MKYRRLYTTSPDWRLDSEMEEHVQRYEGHIENRMYHVGQNCG